MLSCPASCFFAHEVGSSVSLHTFSFAFHLGGMAPKVAKRPAAHADSSARRRAACTPSLSKGVVLKRPAAVHGTRDVSDDTVSVASDRVGAGGFPRTSRGCMTDLVESRAGEKKRKTQKEDSDGPPAKMHRSVTARSNAKAPIRTASGFAQRAQASKRTKPSDFCKNADCAGGGDGLRSRKQSGCKGYCVKCVKIFEPEAYAGRKAAWKETLKFCSRCFQTLAQSGYRGFCKACWPHRDEEVRAFGCFYCQGSGATLELCGWAGQCGNHVPICSVCVAIHGKVVCQVCWQKEWQGSCLGCKADVSTARRSGRLCADCFRQHFCSAGLRELRF